MENTRIAWLVPAVRRGAYWQPVLSHFTKIYPHTKFYTGQTWPGFDPEAPGANVITVIGKYRFQETQTIESGYNRGIIIVSPTVVFPLLKFKPNVVLASSFSIWTLLAILLKPIGQWKLILIHDGSSSNVDFRDDPLRLKIRRWMIQFVDRVIANSRYGKDYLVEFVGVPLEKIMNRPYLVPDTQTLLEQQATIEPASVELKRPVFLCVGLLVPRKGVKKLLEACHILQKKGYSNYSLVLVGDGEQREELESFVNENHLQEQVTWTGWLKYGELGPYFRAADVFIFPTLEDIWGVVLLEAMAFGKAIIASKWAGSSEMVIEGENGYVIDPYEPEKFAQVMMRLIDDPELMEKMGQTSQKLMAEHNAEKAGLFLASQVEKVLEKQNKT
ncbi:MAG: glycosyltransferase family 4 protein [Roseofilum sp. Belize BBD 4]|uniref:glycosyltransferase family 4 protein n=1 Tax=Roseofilum sp. Belize BBD 4 TaxID=2821500 RepID=UPI000E7E2DED|nr:glycosyltransferase family 4 protein [Roseofilum sp. Belize BBD 4]MBP0032822.1 glycosyltransferase family 4 protein [Roseofilum sp. Belize BBD 4]HBQ97171.1 glycosyl transferase [Cyanobacteria bacterium UBA11691]